jgi:hypothetical protein
LAEQRLVGLTARIEHRHRDQPQWICDVVLRQKLLDINNLHDFGLNWAGYFNII